MLTRAAILIETGKPLHLGAVELPPPGRGQVLVRVHVSGICQSQLMEVDGCRGEDRWLPHLLGHEGAGEVVAIGEAVTKVRPGMRVVLTWIRSDGLDAGGVQLQTPDGLRVNAGAITTFSDFTLVSENRCVALPEDVPWEVGALFGCAVPTGAGMVLNTLQPSAGSSLAVWGLGGVGMSALLGAVVCRCQPLIAVDVKAAKLELAGTLGATHLVNAGTVDAVAEVRRLTAGGSAFAVEAAGRCETIEHAFGSLARSGVCVFASHPPAGSRISLDPYEFICGKRLLGSWGGACCPDRDVPRFSGLWRDRRLPCERLVTHTFDLEHINEALALLRAGLAGRVLIRMAAAVSERAS